MVKPVKDFAALLIESPIRTIIVADLHIGFEQELRDAGFMVPAQSWRIANSLIDLIRMHEPERLIVLGDLKHKVPGISKLEWKFLPQIVEEVRKHVDKIILVPGNHDGDIEEIVGNSILYSDAKGTLLEDGDSKIALFHGHAWPSELLLESNMFIMAHMHPVIRIRTDFGFTIRRRVWIKLSGSMDKLARKVLGKRKQKRFRRKFELLIMPSFNDFLSGVAVNATSEGKELIGPIIRSNVIDLSEGDVYLLDGTHVGKISNLVSIA